MNIAHDLVAIVAALLSGGLLVFLALLFAIRFAAQYRQRYLEGTATTLDAMYISMPPQTIVYLGVLLSALLSVVVGVLSGSPGIAIPFGLAGLLSPKLMLHLLKQKRDRMFDYQLVDALMNISNSLRAGFTLTQALELVARELPNPMSQEMRLVCQEARLGVPVDDALMNLYRRMPSQDVDLLVTAVSIVSDVGGNLTEVFDNLAHTIRERHRIEGKIRALTAQGRAQAWVVCLIPVAIGGAMNFVMPDALTKLVTTPLGWALIFVIIVLETIGALVIRKIIAIEV